MKTQYKLLGLVFLLLSQASFAAILGITFGVRMAYMDVTLSCQRGGLRTIGVNLTGVIQNGKLIRATFSSSVDSLQRICLSPQDLAGIQLATDAVGDYYVTVMPMSPRMINFVFSNTDPQFAMFEGCKPTLPLTTMSPFGTTYTFRHFQSNDYISPLQLFRGQRQDGTPWAAKLGFYQVQLE